MTARGAAVAGLALALCLGSACVAQGPDETEGRPRGSGGAPASPQAPAVAGAAGPTGAAPDALPPETGQFTLYFANDDGRLRAETRELSSAGTAGDRARRVVLALIEGPRGPSAPALPPGCTLRALYLTPDGTAYVDFDSGFRRGLSGGSRDALVAVWAITDTLAVNFPEVRAVKILVEGDEVLDLGGHLDLSRPLAPDMSLVEGGSPGSGEEGRP